MYPHCEPTAGCCAYHGRANLGAALPIVPQCCRACSFAGSSESQAPNTIVHAVWTRDTRPRLTHTHRTTAYANELVVHEYLRHRAFVGQSNALRSQGCITTDIQKQNLTQVVCHVGSDEQSRPSVASKQPHELYLQHWFRWRLVDRLGPRCIHLLLTFDSLCDTLGQQGLHFITKRALLTYVYCYAAHDSPAKHRTSTLSTDKPADAGLVRKSGSLPLLLKSSFEVRSLTRNGHS